MIIIQFPETKKKLSIKSVLQEHEGILNLLNLLVVNSF